MPKDENGISPKRRLPIRVIVKQINGMLGMDRPRQAEFFGNSQCRVHVQVATRQCQIKGGRRGEQSLDRGKEVLYYGFVVEQIGSQNHIKCAIAMAH